jgi:hypothetical protein
MKMIIVFLFSASCFAFDFNSVSEENTEFVHVKTSKGFLHLLRDENSNYLISEDCLKTCEVISQMKKILKTKKSDDFVYSNGKNPAAKICLDELKGNLLPGEILEGAPARDIVLCELEDSSIVDLDGIFYWTSFLD